MLDINKYIVNDKVRRGKISSDIKTGILSKDDILSLSDNPIVIESFIGNTIKNKLLKEKWSVNYLERLVCMSAAECFNKEYMLHLHDVSQYIRQKKKKTRNIILGSIVATLTIAAVVIIIVK